MKEINLLHDNSHFDLITSGFHMTSYYCRSCGKTFNNKQLNRCDGVCRLCYRFNEECVATNSLPCNDCGRTFRNPRCFMIPLYPQDGFFGGQTNLRVCTTKLAETKKFSLRYRKLIYLSVNKNELYPIGLPEIILRNFKVIKEYFRLISCKVLPPGKCLYPSLPASEQKTCICIMSKLRGHKESETL